MRLLEKIGVAIFAILIVLLLVSFIKIEKPFSEENAEQKDTYQQEWYVEEGKDVKG